jgi:hypothetical protein
VGAPGGGWAPGAARAARLAGLGPELPLDPEEELQAVHVAGEKLALQQIQCQGVEAGQHRVAGGAGPPEGRIAEHLGRVAPEPRTLNPEPRRRRFAGGATDGNFAVHRFTSLQAASPERGSW